MKKIIITIGRQYGSGGRETAAEVGRRLGIPVYDNALLAEAAAESGFSPLIFKKRDEKHHLFGLSKIFSSRDSDTTNFLSDTSLFQMQSEAIKAVAAKGSCVLVGRAADYILREEEGLVSVFITSPIEDRIDRVVRRLGVDRNTALKIITRKEKNRTNFYNGFTLGKWGEASTYDLCIDSSVLGIEGTAGIIVEFARKSTKTE